MGSVTIVVEKHFDLEGIILTTFSMIYKYLYMDIPCATSPTFFVAAMFFCSCLIPFALIMIPTFTFTAF